MISVCIATYNGAAYIRQQIASILPQLSEGDEIVVSDDGSTDATLAEVRALGSPLVRIVEGPRKGSPVLNFENALSHAKGDYLFLCDQDDVWEPHKVSVMMAAWCASTKGAGTTSSCATATSAAAWPSAAKSSSAPCRSPRP